MAGYIITFRFKETDTSNIRRKNFYDFVSLYPNLTIEEDTTSTIICKTDAPLHTKNEDGFIDKLLQENDEKSNNDKILISDDSVLFIRIKKNNIMELYKVKKLKLMNPLISAIFSS